MEEQSKKEKLIRARTLTQGAYDPNYEFDDRFKPADQSNPFSIHTTAEMLQFLERNPQAEVDAKILGYKDGKLKRQSMDAKALREGFKHSKWDKIQMREGDSFASDSSFSSSLGNDFTPLLGGPFYKNLYYYQDYIRMHAEAFYAYSNDPIAHAIVQITRDFVLGTGYSVQCDTETREGQLAMAAWRAFEEANDLQNQIDQATTEISIYGETMIWKLPHNQTKIVYNLNAGEIPKGVIPRVRIIDPSNIVEIVTYPEDISRALFYVWLTPTQYQIYTSGLGSNQASSDPIQPTLKFIYQQIAASEMLHYKINSVSNEKRGRSDLFPVFSYLKRLRDSVNFMLVTLQKQSAWAIDTQIDGDQADIDAYVASQIALGTIPPAGSEFVHSKQVMRTLLASKGGGSVSNDAFSWCLSMVAAGVGIPVSYFGTHLSGGQTRASALVATEPVAKKMEKRREVVKRILKDLWQYVVQEKAGLQVDCDVIFPEIITQDRSQKLKDILLMQQNRWIKPERAASLAAKEMQIQDYNYKEEIEQMGPQLSEVPLPLTNPGQISKTGQMQISPDQEPGVTGLTSTDKEQIKNDDTTL